MKTDQFSTVRYLTRHKLDISLSEYCFLDIVYHLSNYPESKVKGWAYAKNPYYAKLLGITPRGIQKMKARLIGKLLLVRHAENESLIQTTVVWYHVHIMGQPVPEYYEQSSSQNTNSVRSGNEQSSSNKYSDSPLNKEEEQPTIMGQSFLLIEAINKGGFLEESIANRMEIWKIVEPATSEQWFIDQFKYSTHGLKVKASLQTVMYEWIKNGHWSNVVTFSINKMNGWLVTTGKNLLADGKAKARDKIGQYEFNYDDEGGDSNSFI